MERLFVAIKVEGAGRLLSLARNTHMLMRREKFRWVPENDLHITLRYIGDIDDKDIDKIKNRLKSSVDEFNSFYLQLKGLGNFGSRVLWAGIEDNQELIDLQEKIDNVLKPLIGNEYREYFPHITLARINYMNNKTQFFKIVDANRDTVLDMIHISELCLMRSEIQIFGPVYKVVERYPLLVPEAVNCE